MKKERDDKTSEISEIIGQYEEDLRTREDQFDLLNSDFADQLSVAKKERLDSLAEYDELLKRNYDICQELEDMEDENSKLRGYGKDNEQTITSLHRQLLNLQQERDQALQLWNSSVEERKKLHQEMESLIQSRDASIRTAFQQAEELNKVREDRDALQRALNNNKRNGHLESKEFSRSPRRVSLNGSGYNTSKDHEFVSSCRKSLL